MAILWTKLVFLPANVSGQDQKCSENFFAEGKELLTKKNFEMARRTAEYRSMLLGG